MDKIVLFYSNFSIHCKNILTKIHSIDQFEVQQICIDHVEIRKLLQKAGVQVVPHLTILQNGNVTEQIIGSDVNNWLDSLINDIQLKKTQKQSEIMASEMREREMREREMREREMRERETSRVNVQENNQIEEDEDFTPIESLGIISRAPNKKPVEEFEPSGTTFQEDDDFINEKKKRLEQTLVKPDPSKKKFVNTPAQPEKTLGGSLEDIAKQMEKNREKSLEDLSRK